MKINDLKIQFVGEENNTYLVADFLYRDQKLCKINKDGRFINAVDEFVETDNEIGNSSITVSVNILTANAIKVESRTGLSGHFCHIFRHGA